MAAIAFSLRIYLREAFCISASVTRNSHTVLIQNDNKLQIRAAIIKRLVNHSARKCTVSDDAYGMLISTVKHRRLGVTESRGDRGRAMTCAECIMLTLTHQGEARKTSRCAKIVKSTLATCEDLVYVGLMADVKDDVISRRIENAMQCHRELGHAEVGSKMTATRLYLFNEKGSDLIAEIGYVGIRNRFQILGRIYIIQNSIFHKLSPITYGLKMAVCRLS